MINKIKKAAILTAAVMTVSAFQGCALVQFEDPDSLKIEESQLPSGGDTETAGVTYCLDSEKLRMEDSLKDSEGREIAIYKVAFPYFDDGGASQAVANINDYYESEFDQIDEDKKRFFDIVSQKPSQYVRSSIFDYRVLEAPDEYVSVLRRFEGVDSLGVAQENYYGEVFSSSTGWKLRFSDIFGEKSPDAYKYIVHQLESWCEERGYAPNWIYGIPEEELTENFAFDGEKAYIGIKPHTVAGGESLAELPLGELADYIK